MAEGKHGIVYIADWPEQWLEEWADDTPRYHGYWDSGTEPGKMLEDGPGWDDPEEAITWGREHAPKVIIRIGTQHYSAGEEEPEGNKCHVGSLASPTARASFVSIGPAQCLVVCASLQPMTFDDDFTQAQQALADYWGFAYYEAALRSWIATVAIVEVGYVGEWEEYTNELAARDYLEELMRRSPGSRSAVEEDLRVWDDRFRAATVEEEKPHLPPLEGEPGWWQYRSPRSWRRPASEELCEHLDSGDT